MELGLCISHAYTQHSVWETRLTASQPSRACNSTQQELKTLYDEV